MENQGSTGFTRGSDADDCCPTDIEKYLIGNGNDRRAYGGPKKTHGGNSLCGVGLPPEAPIVLCCGCVGFVGSTPAIEAIQPATPPGNGFGLVGGPKGGTTAPAPGACT